MESHEEADEGVEHPVTEEGDGEPSPGEQRAVGKRVVEVSGDQETIHRSVIGSAGDGCNHLDRRQPVVGELSE